MSGKKCILEQYSGFKWKAVKNSSWSSDHAAQFGIRPGYVICYQNRYGELCALGSVIGQPNVTQVEIDANAKLIELAPRMGRVIEKINQLNGARPVLTDEILKDLASIYEDMFLKEDKKPNKEN